jgi:DNA-binding response OmpR family regulator
MHDTHGETASKHESGQTITADLDTRMRTLLVEGDRNGARCRRAGRQRQDDYLIKPCDVRDLLVRISVLTCPSVLNR